MRLLNTSNLKLSYFEDAPKSEYAILSHTWGNGEVLFEDIRDGNLDRAEQKAGFSKIKKSCAVAKQEGFDWIWIDTCCIDKTSSAELSEAINSMFDWYEWSGVCLAFLSDVRISAGSSASAAFGSCRWFARGWTLQELIAPRWVKFYDRDWRLLGDRVSLAKAIAARTRIDEEVLTRHIAVLPPQEIKSVRALLVTYPVSTKMAWAAERKTTRTEDRSYSLMGLFDVNMPLLYGEGHKSFYRLQEEIIKSHNDQSILTDITLDNTDAESCLAVSPDAFTNQYEVLSQHWAQYKMFSRDNGIVLDVILCPIEAKDPSKRAWKVAILACCVRADTLLRPGILVEESPEGSGQYKVARNHVYNIGPSDTRILLEDLANSYFDSAGRFSRFPNKAVIKVDQAAKANIFLAVHQKKWNESGLQSRCLPTLNVTLQLNNAHAALDRIVSIPPLSHLDLAKRREEYHSFEHRFDFPIITLTRGLTWIPDWYDKWGKQLGRDLWALCAAMAVQNDDPEPFIILWGFTPKLNEALRRPSSSISLPWECRQPFCVVATWEEMGGKAFSPYDVKQELQSIIQNASGDFFRGPEAFLRQYEPENDNDFQSTTRQLRSGKVARVRISSRQFLDTTAFYMDIDA